MHLLAEGNSFSSERTMGLIHEPFLRTDLFLSPTYEDFTKIVAFMNFFLSRIQDLKEPLKNNLKG